MRVEYSAQANVASVFPDGPLGKADFDAVAAQIDPVIERHGQLNGLIIASFPLSSVPCPFSPPRYYHG